MNVSVDESASASKDVAVATVQNLIRVVEVWTPNESGDRLQLNGGVYGSLDEFRQASESVTFARGEAFPGMVWESLSPLVLPDLYVEEFQRSGAARKAGLTSGIAIPVVENNELRAVVLLLCDQAQGAQGAFEVWKHDNREELGLSSDYYANLERFSSISRFIKFPRGAGLPGGVWDYGLPRVIDGLTPESGFARASGTGAEGLQIAIGLPILRSAFNLDSVVLILSARSTPMAKGFQVWSGKPTDAEFTVRESAYAARERQRGESDEVVRNLVADVRSLRHPLIVSPATSNESPGSSNWSLGLPVFDGTDLQAVLTILN